MANEENLIPGTERSQSESRENGRKGGIKSGESRRRRKALRTALKEAISLTLKDLHPDLKNGIMRAARIRDDGLTIGDAILGSIVRSACNGNSQMAKLLLDTIGESMDARIRERELKLKERALGTGQLDATLNVTITEKETQSGECSEGD